MHVYMHVHACMYVCVQVYMSEFVVMCICVFECVHVCMHANAHALVCSVAWWEGGGAFIEGELGGAEQNNKKTEFVNSEAKGQLCN